MSSNPLNSDFTSVIFGTLDIHTVTGLSPQSTNSNNSLNSSEYDCSGYDYDDSYDSGYDFDF